MNTSILGIKMLFLQQFNKIAVMDTIQIKDKRFTPFIPEERILKEVARVASEINRDLEGTNPLFLSIERRIHVCCRLDA